MNWELDINYPYVWQVKNTPFGVEKINHACYVPFRLWNKNRIYIGKYSEKGRENLMFTSRQKAMLYVEQAVKNYQKQIIA